LQDRDPVVLFYERFQASSGFTEPTFDPSVFQLSHYPDAVRSAAQGTLDHTYSGLYAQDKLAGDEPFDGEFWRAHGLGNLAQRRAEHAAGVDPRLGIAYSLGTKRNIVIRAGSGLFHGIVPGAFAGLSEAFLRGTDQFRPQEDDLNSVTQLWGFASGVGPGGPMQSAFNNLIAGSYPDNPANPVPGFEGPATIVRFTKTTSSLTGFRTACRWSLSRSGTRCLNVTYLRTHGVHLGSFFNINQAPNPVTPQICGLHDSRGDTGCKAQFVPASANFLFFEADSRWYSEFDGLLVNLNRRLTHHVGFGLSYTWSKSLDDGPNPSFVLIPQNSFDFRAEKSLSADHVAHRFVGNATFEGPTNLNRLLNHWQLSTIISLESPHYFTKFAGLDTNGDAFPINDRVGIEPRDTFKGDSYQSVDLRISRTFKFTERVSLEALAESFNTLNTVNIRFFNTVYSAPDFIPAGTTAHSARAHPTLTMAHRGQCLIRGRFSSRCAWHGRSFGKRTNDRPMRWTLKLLSWRIQAGTNGPRCS